jgi:bifunctional non-homologous end joining protein LigD
MVEKLTKVNFSNIDKILYPSLNITKAQFIEFYIKLAPKMLPFLSDRPIVLTRYPNGVDKEGFYAKDAPNGTPDWVKTARIYSPSTKRYIRYLVCNDLDTLLWMANLAAVEIHMPLSKVDSREVPDFVFFDVDPEPPATIDQAVEVALRLNEILEGFGFKAYIKTSGKKGLHILLPIERRYVFEQTRSFVHKIGQYLSKEMSMVVSEFSDTKKPGKVFIDYGQNSHGKTLICPYSLRATPDATVSTPLDWADLKKKINPTEFNIKTVPSLKKDPWKDIFLTRQKLEVNYR